MANSRWSVSENRNQVTPIVSKGYQYKYNNRQDPEQSFEGNRAELVGIFWLLVTTKGIDFG